MTSNCSDQWLTRTTDNHISGPYSLQDIRNMIQQGKLELNDEVCHANAYWFYIHELQEVRNQLGMEVPKILYTQKSSDGTQTQTDKTDIERTDPEIGATRMAPRIPELSQPLEEVGENTAVMSNRAFRDFRQKKKTEAAPAQVQTENSAIHGAVAPTDGRRLPERSKLFHFFTYLMMMGAVAVLILVMRLLQQRPI